MSLLGAWALKGEAPTARLRRNACPQRAASPRNIMLQLALAACLTGCTVMQANHDPVRHRQYPGPVWP